jgi:hypothetical protein
LKLQFDGFSKRNAVVPSATSRLLKSLAVVTGETVVVVMSSPSGVLLLDLEVIQLQAFWFAKPL